jgi:lipopolysaccharide transport system ATP-binding protein
MTLPDDVAIQATSLSKKYRLFESPRQRLKEALDPWGRTFHKDFWALRDVDLTVKKGQTVGVIGRNGSGKSTLLQLVTSVLQPTSGTVEAAGRIAALLSLGAGFDPNFTGRDNVRQFSGLQGLAPGEIESRIPKVQEFARIGDFFDRPVRLYSSGMFARLAFATAINVDPDILILDEILAVGDARFQRRCFERIKQLQDDGTTILLVSHALETVISHCDTVILLDNGRVLKVGDPITVTNHYRQLMFEGNASEFGSLKGKETKLTNSDIVDSNKDAKEIARSLLTDMPTKNRFKSRPGYNPEETIHRSGDAELLDYRLFVNGASTSQNVFSAGQKLRLFVLAQIGEHQDEAQFGFAFRRLDGLYVYGTNSLMRPDSFLILRDQGRFVFSFALRLSIHSGQYFFDLGVYRDVAGNPIMLLARRGIIHITVRSTPYFDGVADIVAD